MDTREIYCDTGAEGSEVRRTFSPFTFGFDSNTGDIKGITNFDGSNTVTGNYSFAEGHGNSATNSDSFAIGNGCTASGQQSFAGGYQSTASNTNAFVFGN